MQKKIKLEREKELLTGKNKNIKFLPRFFAIIPSAGNGSRAGGVIPKQYCTIGDKTLLSFSIASFLACEKIHLTLVALAPNDHFFNLSEFSNKAIKSAYCGGGTRQQTVLNALKHLLTNENNAPNDDDWVLIHDAARPGITPSLINKLIETIGDHPVGGILALPLADTLKRIIAIDHTDFNNSTNTQNNNLNQPMISHTESREGLWLAQTPQMFRLGLLFSALKDAEDKNIQITDEASALERLGYQPLLVQGDLKNFKVTYPNDFAIIERLLIL